MTPEIKKIINEIETLRQGQPPAVANPMNQAVAALLHAGERFNSSQVARIMPKIERIERTPVERPAGIPVVTPNQGPPPVEAPPPKFDWRNL